MTRDTFFLSCLFTLLCTTCHAQFEHGITADYYNGTQFHSFVRSRIEKQIGFSRKLKSPAPGVGKEFFSIRYTGSIKAPKTGLYNFYVLADDGVRVWINHQLIIDAWLDQEAAAYTGSIMLDQDETYDIKIEYYNSIVHSVLTVRWEIPMENFQLFDLGHQPIVTPIPTEVIIPTSSQPKQRSRLLIGSMPEKPVTNTVMEVKVIPPTTNAKPVSKRRTGIIVENEPIIFKTVVFEQQSFMLKEGAAKELDHLVKYLKTFDTKKIEISGYTDYAGDSVDNQILSEQRAKTIARYLVKGGIEESRISSNGYGSRFPLIVSKNLKDRHINRRVEFKIVD